jgi:phytoene/squalene synthetase
VGEAIPDATAEENMLIELIRRDDEKNSGLQAYLLNMMKVMEFDVNRRGRLITQSELSEYTRWLAVAVTEAMHYFIGHSCHSPHDETRYLAVTGAHITHMLRDTFDDVQAGYYNIPGEVLEAGHIRPQDIESKAYRDWVRIRVWLARECFKAGRDYLARVENPRCRLAGLAYTARFEWLLDTVEREGYRLVEIVRRAVPDLRTRAITSTTTIVAGDFGHARMRTRVPFREIPRFETGMPGQTVAGHGDRA